MQPIVIANHKCEIDSGETTIVPWFRFDSEDGRGQTFADEALAYLDQEFAGPDDLVLIHTMAMFEFSQFMLNFTRIMWHEAITLPTFYLILRRDPGEFDGAQHRNSRIILEKAFGCSILNTKVILCTDTDQLSEAWSEAVNRPFITLPIPFRHELVTKAEFSQPPNAPRSIVYLGDARIEKGYQHLPNVVRTLWDRFIERGLVECVFQSNYNLPGGEEGIPEARLRLQQFPYGIRLLTHNLKPDEYYEILARADIVVLPYDPELYSRRSSGVLNEAVIAGKVTVVPKGSWLASQVSPTGAVIYEHPQGLSDAVGRALAQFETISREARAYAPRRAALHSPAMFISRLLELQSRNSDQPGPSVLFIADGDQVRYLTGAGSVVANQLTALTELGYRIHAVFHQNHIDDHLDIGIMRNWIELVFETIRRFRLTSVWGVGYLPFTNGIGIYPEREIFRRRGTGLNGTVRFRESLAAPAGLFAALRRDPPELVFVNYVHNIALARNLAGADVPMVCEIHDIQSFQFAMDNRQGLQQRDIDREVGLLSEAERIISLNRLEKQFLDRHMAPEKVLFIPQPSQDPPSSAQDLAGATNLAELIEACGPLHPSMARDSGGVGPLGSLLHRLRALTGIDLLYISSRHLPNLRGIQWFVQHVYFPMLAPLGINW